MTSLIQRARDVAGRLLFLADSSDMGRKPDKTATTRNAAAIIAELIERIEGVESTVDDLQEGIAGESI